MIDVRDGREAHDCMAVLTNVCRRDMRRWLADRLDAVVAGDAISGNVVVIEIRRYETDCRVTVFAGVAAEDMVCVLADGKDVVVTANARAQHLKMIDFRNR